MAGTDDIAEKVADILLEQSAKAANFASRTAPKVVEGVGSVTSVAVSQLIEAVKKDKNLRHMMNLEGEVSVAEMNQLIHKFGQRSFSVAVHDSDAQDYEDLLKEQGILYSKLDKQNDNHKLFIFLNKDLQKVDNVTTILKAQRGQVSELRPDLYFNSLSPDKVHVVEGISAVEMELFRHYARQKNLLYTAIPGKDSYMMICDKSDIKKAREALLYTGWALTGANGARVREQVERRLAGRSAIQISAEEGEREMYIVSGIRPDNYVKISAEDFAVYKQNKQVASVSRQDPNFMTKCLAACDSIAHPVVMSDFQFRQDLTPQDMENAHTIDLFPEFYDSIIEMEQINRLVNLVAMKSGLDDEHNATWGLWDPSVSYSSFSEYEFISDEEERDARQYEFEHFKQAAYYSQDHHTAMDVDMDEKNLDYIIARAEQKRKEQEGQQPQRSGIDYSWSHGTQKPENEADRDE